MTPGVKREASASPHPGYRAAHLRIANANGKASQHPCRCGRPASDWSYNGLCRDERRQVVRGYPLAYCLHPWHYAALCRSCHLRKDRAAR